MSLHALAGHMATKGRGGDSMLVHMTPGEVQALQALAKRHGGTLTINPETGQPEANFLKKILPMVAGFALGPAGFGLMSAGMAGAAVGGITALSTGSLSRGLMAGLGAYGGASLGASLAGAGAGTSAANAAALGVEGAATGIGSQAAMLAEQTAGFGAEGLSSLADSARVAVGAAPSKAGMLSAGFDAVTKSPETLGKFAKSNYGALAAAASPLMAADTVQTTTQRPDTGTIRNFTFDPYGQTYASAGNYPASEYRGMAQGGIVALADGGMSATYFAANPDVAAAYANRSNDPNLASTVNMTPEQFAQTHYDKFGKNEQRDGPAGFFAPTAETANANAYLAANPDVAAYMTSKAGLDYMTSNPQFDAADIALTHYNRYGQAEGRTWGAPATTPEVTTPEVTAPEVTTPATNAPAGTTNPYGNPTNPGDQTFNPDGSITVQPNIPGRPYGGFSGMQQVRDAYTRGGGSLGYVNPAPRTMEEFDQRFNTQTGDSLAAYNYLMGQGANPATQQRVGEIARPYSEAIRGIPAAEGRPMQKYIYQNGRYVENPNYRPVSYNSKGERLVGLNSAEVRSGLQGLTDPADDGALFDFVSTNRISEAQLAAALGISLAEARTRLAAGEKKKKPFAPDYDPSSLSMGANGGLMGMAGGGYAVGGGLGALAGGGQAGYNLGGYSDGGRLLKGPGDGVSDSIPATIGDRQPARLADGEFVVPARIVSELGNGSTEAGARKLYAMMDRVQKARGKTTGKNRVAANTRSEKYLPA